MHGLRQLEDLVGQLDQLDVLLIFLLDHLPLEVGCGLPLEVGTILADHHERRQEDRLERNDHRQQSGRIALDAEDDSHREPNDVEVDERHRAGEPGDDIGNPLLDACCARFGVLGERRVNLPCYLPL
jgi:hypothetical protein